MRARFLFLAIVLAIVFVSSRAQPDPVVAGDGAALSLRATEDPDYSLPRWMAVGGVALVAAMFALALISAPETEGKTSPEISTLGNLYLKVRFAGGTPHASGGQLGYLRSLSRHGATMVTRCALPKGAAVRLSLPTGTDQGDEKRVVHARVVHCRAADKRGDWMVVRLRVDHDPLDEQLVRSAIAALTTPHTMLAT